MPKGTILVPVDHSPITKGVLKFINDWVKQTGDTPLFLYAIKKNRMDRQYSGFIEKYMSHVGFDQMFEETFPIGTPYLEILKEEKRCNPKLIVMAAHSHSTIGRLLLGSNSDYVLHHSKSPVYLFKIKRREYKNNILVPIDFTKVNKSVIKLADNWAKHWKSKLIFIHVCKDYEFEYPSKNKKIITDELVTKLEKYIKAAKVKSPFKFVVTHGNPYEGILKCEEKNKSRLIMMASHSHTLARRILMGGTTDKICHNSKCSVLVYKEKPKKKPPG